MLSCRGSSRLSLSTPRPPSSAPSFAIWHPEGGFIVENEGVAPDHDVTMWPKDVIAGKDPQLEKAIELALEALKKNPPKKDERPEYPRRVKP